MTPASHAGGPRFESGRAHFLIWSIIIYDFSFWICISLYYRFKHSWKFLSENFWIYLRFQILKMCTVLLQNSKKSLSERL